ncbi:MAG: cation diffusion facilitator family transporter [Myxococcota bacterium]
MAHSDPTPQGHPRRYARPAGAQLPPGSGVANLAALRGAFAVTSSILLLEAVGGWLTGSIALLADAGHMLTDAGSLGLALFAAHLRLRPTSARKTFGYGRAEILAALANGLLLGATSVAIAIESLRRLRSPEPIDAVPMLSIACIGLAANLFAAWLLARSDRTNLNVRGALAHVLGDALGSLAAIGAAIAIWAWELLQADAIAGLGIAGLLVAAALRLVRGSVDILLEGAPEDLDLERLAADVCELPGVAGIHDLHIWTVTSGFPAMSGHVDLAPGADGHEVQRAVSQLLRARYGIEHTTIQTEPAPRLHTIDPASD